VLGGEADRASLEILKIFAALAGNIVNKEKASAGSGISK
jgi:hypothetical protein